MRSHPLMAAAIGAELAACVPHYMVAGPAWQPYFRAVRAGEVHSPCDDAAARAVERGGGRLAIVLTEKDEPHMVAIDRLGLVRDNRVAGPVFWWQLPYVWVTAERRRE